MGNLAWRFGSKEREYVEEVLSSGFASSTSGSMCNRLEKAFAEKVGKSFAVAMNSGTTTLHSSLVALGVKPGDEVILPVLTVISCLNAVIYCGAIPVFADVDPDTFLMDAEDVERKVTARTKAIMAVNLYGLMCNMPEIMRIARKYNLKVLEDNAQNYLGSIDDKLIFGDVASWSFENSKHLTCGDGGIIATDDEELALKIRKLGSQGFKNITSQSGQIRKTKDWLQDPEYVRHDTLGFMYRMSELQAAVALAQVEKIHFFVGLRRRSAQCYLHAIESSGADWLIPQFVPSGHKNSYYTFAAKYLNEDVSWYDFRKKYMEYSNDGVYAAWKLLTQEGSIPDTKEYLRAIGFGNRLDTFDTKCPNAEFLQKRLMQFPTNMRDDDEMERNAEALYKALKYFK